MSFTKSFSFLLAVAIAFPITELFADDETTGYMEEIIVTAEKREESVMDVPVTMSAFTNKMIQDLGIASEDDLEQLVPGLQFQDNGQMTGQGTTIRGIGTRLAGETHPDLAVATYVNGVYTLGTYGAAPNMFDNVPNTCCFPRCKYSGAYSPTWANKYSPLSRIELLLVDANSTDWLFP